MKKTLEMLGFKYKEEIVKNDENGNLIYKQASGIEEWWTYEGKNRLTEYRNSYGKIEQHVYNEERLESKSVYYQDELQLFEKYNEQGKIVYDKETNGLSCEERWFEYDEHGNIIYRKESYGSEMWSTFDDNDREITRTFSNGRGWARQYDDCDQIVYQKDIDTNLERFWSYDDKGMQTEYRDSNGYWEKIEYFGEECEGYHKTISTGGEEWEVEEGTIRLENGEYLLYTRDDERVAIGKVKNET